MTVDTRLPASDEASEFLGHLPRRWAQSLLWVIICLLVSLLVWASLARVDMTVPARGLTVYRGQPTWVAVGTSGTVTSVTVHSGSLVKAGDSLFKVQSPGQVERSVAAPQDGMVAQIRVVVGGQVGDNEPGVAIWSADEPCMFEAQVANRDVGRVRVGMAAEVTLDAYPSDTIPATVDSMVPWLDSALAEPPFKVYCSLGRQTVNDGDVRRVSPTLSGTAHLVLGEQRLIDVVLKPLR